MRNPSYRRLSAGRGGFTLVEVLAVVVIAVLVTMFAVPSYRRAQERNRYLAATGVLMDMGNAARMLHADYPDIVYTRNFTSNATWTTCPEEPTTDNLVTFLQCHKYLGEIPFSNARYQGYLYRISLQGTTSTCGACGSVEWVACMYDSSASVSEYQCAYIDKQGNLHHN